MLFRSTVNIVLYGGTVLYGRTPSFQTDRTCTVSYGVLRYGTVITVKKAEVRRISTSLTVIERGWRTKKEQGLNYE